MNVYNKMKSIPSITIPWATPEQIFKICQIPATQENF